MVFIKRSVVKLELTGEETPEWLRDNKISKTSARDTEEVQDETQEESKEDK